MSSKSTHNIKNKINKVSLNLNASQLQPYEFGNVFHAMSN